jgi:hypothetical protein
VEVINFCPLTSVFLLSLAGECLQGFFYSSKWGMKKIMIIPGIESRKLMPKK